MIKADVGIYGGSGFYSLTDDIQEVEIDTPYGKPSDKIMIARGFGGKTVAFLPRHGRSHGLPPHLINYRANAMAFKQLGIERVIAPFAAGSLQKAVKPGDFVVMRQFVDRTTGRHDTFFEGPDVKHPSAADPYCPQLSDLAVKACEKNGVEVHDHGTVVVINGPRFSTRAESQWFSREGWNVINMTQYPEQMLARELGICYAGIALITDYDVGFEGVAPVSHDEVVAVFKANNDRLKGVLESLVASIPKEKNCACSKPLG